MEDFPLLYKGSVKDIFGRVGVAPYIFSYSDRYSIYDWGEMPDTIPQKGEVLCQLAIFFFEEAKKIGIPTHFQGASPTCKERLSVLPVDLPDRPLEDYHFYKKKPTNALVPLEVLFRFGLPLGSSLPKRKNIDPKTTWEIPYIEFSTKLERSDRYISDEEAQSISSMSDEELEKLKKITVKLALHLQTLFKATGLTLWDGKFEFAFIKGEGSRDFMLVDSIGPDELRVTYNYKGEDILFSKEFFRQFYRRSLWYEHLEKAKSLAMERGVSDWKSLMRSSFNTLPERLTKEALHQGVSLYKTLANTLFIQHGQKAPFDGPQTIKDLIYELTYSR